MSTTIKNGTECRHFFVTATDPAGEWSDPIYVDFRGIDPSFYFEGGKAYYMSNEGDGTESLKGSTGITMAEIDTSTGKLKSTKKVIWNGSGAACLEGPHLFRHNGWYYLLAAQGGFHDHMETIARSRELFGPYESCERNPILSHKDYFLSPIQGVGHMDMIDDANGNWWAVFLGIRIAGIMFHHLGRETFLAPVTWSKDGFPIINGGNLIELKMEIDDNLLPQPIDISATNSFVDYFDGDKLDFRWNFLRCERDVSYRLKKGLVIQSNGTNISKRGTPTWIGTRQKDLDCEMYCKMKFDFKDTAEFGLTLFYDNTRHFDFLVSNNDGDPEVLVRKTFDDMITIPHQVAYDCSEIILHIQADPYIYHFGYGKTEEDAKNNIVASGWTRHLAMESSFESFTGVYVAMFAQGGMESHAKVEYFKYVSGGNER